MEGPSLKIAAEQLSPFIGKDILKVSGNSKENKDILLGQKVLDIFSWGKHLLIQFENNALKVHFLLWGSYKAEVNGKDVKGEYYREGVPQIPRLLLEFQNGSIGMFNCSVKISETKNIKNEYDFSVDILSIEWDKRKALEQIKSSPSEEIADILLDQEIFSGVGNIIKNEVLFRQKVNPKTVVADIAEQKLKEIIVEARIFSEQFYEWRKKFELKKHLEIYRKPNCPIHNTKVTREKTGKRKRMSFYCQLCQPNLSSI